MTIQGQVSSGSLGNRVVLVPNGYEISALDELAIAGNPQLYYEMLNFYQGGYELTPHIAREPDTGDDNDDGGNGNNGNGGNPDNDNPDTSPPGLTYDPNKVPKTGGYKDLYIDGFDDGFGGATIPIILDLDGDGVEVAFGEDIYFDLDDDGFLVIDRNADGTRGVGDGVIDQSNELVLSSLGLEGDTDLQALARYDDNNDGKLDASDAIWNELKVWQDLNQDGKTEGDGTELKTLAAWIRPSYLRLDKFWKQVIWFSLALGVVL